MSERLAPEQHDSLEGVAEPAENRRLIGHEAAVSALATAYRARKLHHALLLTGPKGIGKATLAFHLARYLLANREPENAPDSFGSEDVPDMLFRQVASGAHPAVLHLTRPYDDKSKKFRTGITVDEVRRVSRFLSMRSHDDSYRAVIVDPADDMNRNAANALLKSLEEPPARVVFVLISHSPGALLPTIRSRCQAVRLEPLAPGQIGAVLASLDMAAPSAELAQLSAGSARQAILLSEYGGLDIIHAADRILAQSRRDPLDSYKLADAVIARENEVRFEILNRHLVDRVAGEAAQAAEGGDVRRARRLAELWGEVNRTIIETTTYNLDRRQHVVGLLGRIGDTLAA